MSLKSPLDGSKRKRCVRQATSDAFSQATVHSYCQKVIVIQMLFVIAVREKCYRDHGDIRSMEEKPSLRG